jgi:hypothetical protein
MTVLEGNDIRFTPDVPPAEYALLAAAGQLWVDPAQILRLCASAGAGPEQTARSTVGCLDRFRSATGPLAEDAEAHPGRAPCQVRG